MGGVGWHATADGFRGKESVHSHFVRLRRLRAKRSRHVESAASAWNALPFLRERDRHSGWAGIRSLTLAARHVERETVDLGGQAWANENPVVSDHVRHSSRATNWCAPCEGTMENFTVPPCRPDASFQARTTGGCIPFCPRHFVFPARQPA